MATPNKLKIGPNCVVAKAAVSLIDFFNAENCAIVYEIDGTYRSWAPGRDINPFTETTAGKGYLIWAKEIIDATAGFDAFPTKSIGIKNQATDSVIVTIYNGDESVAQISAPIATNGFFKAFLQPDQVVIITTPVNVTVAIDAVSGSNCNVGGAVLIGNAGATLEFEPDVSNEITTVLLTDD